MAADRCSCPSCGASVDPGLIPPGGKVRCPECQLVVYIPTDDDAPSSCFNLSRASGRRALRRPAGGAADPNCRSAAEADGAFSACCWSSGRRRCRADGPWRAVLIGAAFWLSKASRTISRSRSRPRHHPPRRAPHRPLSPRLPPPRAAAHCRPTRTPLRDTRTTQECHRVHQGGRRRRRHRHRHRLLVQADKDTGFLVSNHHVIAPRWKWICRSAFRPAFGWAVSPRASWASPRSSGGTAGIVRSQ
jgi:hypothetical protein